MHVLPACIYVHYLGAWNIQRPEEDIIFHGIGVIGGWMSPSVPEVLCKNNCNFNHWTISPPHDYCDYISYLKSHGSMPKSLVVWDKARLTVGGEPITMRWQMKLKSVPSLKALGQTLTETNLVGYSSHVFNYSKMLGVGFYLTIITKIKKNPLGIAT